MPETVGFIGLGLMGRPMAKNVLKKGFPLVVHSRSQGPVDDLVAAGHAGASPADVARLATRIITMVPDSPDVELVLDGPNGVFSALQPGTIIIDMSSIAPGAGAPPRGARQIARRHDARCAGQRRRDRRHRRHAVDHGRRRPRRLRCRQAAPRCDGESREGRSRRRVGRRSNLQALQPDGDRRHARGRGRGAGVGAQGRRRCRRKFARRSSADSPPSRVLEVHGERALKGTYKPGFKTHLFAKDMRNVVSTLAEHDAAAPVTAVVQQLLNATMAAGRGEDDNSVMAKTVFELAGVE